MTSPLILQTGARTYLRHPVTSDSREYLELRRASQELHRPWEPVPAAGVDPFSQCVFDSYLAGAVTPRCERLLIVRLKDDRILGAINFNEIVRGIFQSAYTGYWIGAEFAHQGYMSEGLELALRYGFETLGLHRLEANVRPENKPSLALVKRLGFKLEGYSPRYLKIAGEWCDHERWTILSEDVPQ